MTIVKQVKGSSSKNHFSFQCLSPLEPGHMNFTSPRNLRASRSPSAYEIAARAVEGRS